MASLIQAKMWPIKEKENNSCSYSGQILFPMASCNNASLRFSYLTSTPLACADMHLLCRAEVFICSCFSSALIIYVYVCVGTYGTYYLQRHLLCKEFLANKSIVKCIFTYVSQVKARSGQFSVLLEAKELFQTIQTIIIMRLVGQQASFHASRPLVFDSLGQLTVMAGSDHYFHTCRVSIRFLLLLKSCQTKSFSSRSIIYN